MWRLKLQELATELGKTIHVCHFPPGTSKWNKIEHRLFSHITQNWRGKLPTSAGIEFRRLSAVHSAPLTSLQVVVNLIRNTRTKAGKTVQARLDPNLYPTGIKVTDTELDAIAIEGDTFHGEWNYIIQPLIAT